MRICVDPDAGGSWKPEGRMEQDGAPALAVRLFAAQGTGTEGLRAAHPAQHSRPVQQTCRGGWRSSVRWRVAGLGGAALV